MDHKRFKKITKILGTGVEAMMALDAKQLKEKILEASTNLEQERATEAGDLDLTAAKDEVKCLAAPYKENKDLYGAQIAFCIHRQAEIGRPLAR